MGNRAVFLDRDGVINRAADWSEYYITSVEKFHFIDGIFEAVSLLNSYGYIVIVVTNQRGVPRGYLSMDTLNQIHQYMTDEFSKNGACITAVKACVCDQTNPCECRKPKPGMLQKSSEEFSVDLRESWIIGDSESDIYAGKSAGCKTALLSSKSRRNDSSSNWRSRPDIVVGDVLSAVEQILGLEK